MLWLGVGLFTGYALAQETPNLKGQKERVSYALGLDLGNQFRRQGVEVNPDLFLRGLRDALGGGEALLSELEARAAIAELQDQIKKKQQAITKELGEKNRKEGEAFLAANKLKEGVVTLDSTLQYKVLKAGEGKKPTIDDTVVCHYRGTLIDGTEFDSSYKRNTPATLPVKKLIKGWSEALQLMPAGSKWQIFIPSTLAYGERGTGNLIGPNATLIFEVELLSIQEKP
jgi:FKBP-type peptidyl-prolyl cis-trans isomerase FklB